MLGVEGYDLTSNSASNWEELQIWSNTGNYKYGDL